MTNTVVTIEGIERVRRKLSDVIAAAESAQAQLALAAMDVRPPPAPGSIEERLQDMINAMRALSVPTGAHPHASYVSVGIFAPDKELQEYSRKHGTWTAFDKDKDPNHGIWRFTFGPDAYISVHDMTGPADTLVIVPGEPEPAGEPIPPPPDDHEAERDDPHADKLAKVLPFDTSGAEVVDQRADQNPDPEDMPW